MSQMNMTEGRTKNLRKNDGDIPNNLEKELNASEEDGADIHGT